MLLDRAMKLQVEFKAVRIREPNWPRVGRPGVEERSIAYCGGGAWGKARPSKRLNRAGKIDKNRAFVESETNFLKRGGQLRRENSLFRA